MSPQALPGGTLEQVLQSLKDGSTKVVEVPAPRAGPGQVLIQTARSVVSAGTERMLLEFGKANWIDKARQQPDKVRMVLDKARTDGIAATLDAVQSKLDQPLQLGYCNVGRVLEVGPGVTGLAPGDRVASNGKHAELVVVPQNLCAKIPDGVSDDDASFAVLGAISLQGIRLTQPTLGESIVVMGLGLIGLLTVQILRAHGCRVLGLDFDAERLSRAEKYGAEVCALSEDSDPLPVARRFSRERGVDAVIITASTKSNEPVSQAAKMCRKRGRIVLVGVTGLHLSRADFFEKELSFQVSCSYGPGRYDTDYEDRGLDYPVGFVRWTEQRNFEAVLDLMASGKLNATDLISHRFDFGKAEDAYELLTTGEPSLGIVLDYDSKSGATPLRSSTIRLRPGTPDTGQGRIAFLGAGNYASRELIPAFKQAGAQLQTIVSNGGVSARHHGDRHGFRQATTDPDVALRASNVDAVVIATRHNLHAAQVLAALRAGKHVFCEKPLCLGLDELEAIERETSSRPRQLLMVGFNRRFAPLVVRLKELIERSSQPKAFIMTVNAGAIPHDHWTQDPRVGGGRIVGEGCHFIDLLRHLAGAPVRTLTAHPLVAPGAGAPPPDSATIAMGFEDGSTGTVHYFANGHRGFPKERLEVFCEGQVLQLDNFRRLRGWGVPGSLLLPRALTQDKGQKACAAAFLGAITGDAPTPIPLDEVLEVSRLSIEAQVALGSG